MSTNPPAENPDLQKESGVLPRQCGRCRQLFDGDPTLFGGAQVEWWTCPACHDAILPEPPKASAAPS